MKASGKAFLGALVHERFFACYSYVGHGVFFVRIKYVG